MKKLLAILVLALAGFTFAQSNSEDYCSQIANYLSKTDEISYVVVDSGFTEDDVDRQELLRRFQETTGYSYVIHVVPPFVYLGTVDNSLYVFYGGTPDEQGTAYGCLLKAQIVAGGGSKL